MAIHKNRVGLLELNNHISQKIAEIDCSQLWVKARIQELNIAYNGHCYLSLVELDANNKIIAQARATIWASTFSMIKPYFETETGMSLTANLDILVRVAVKFHPIYGLSINIYDIDPKYTIGEIEVAKQKTIQQLINDGVYDMNHELELPIPITRIAVISSETAAGYQDFENQLNNNRHHLKFKFKLFQAVVQGEAAPQSIIQAIEKVFEELENYDILVIIRGGGSKADLICFDDYELCFTAAQIPLPIITGIGHERDESVMDLIAHTNLKTPTAVAEFLIDYQLSLYQQLIEKANRIEQLVKNSLNLKKQELILKQSQLNSAARLKIQDLKKELIIKQNQIGSQAKLKLEKHKQELENLKQKIQSSVSHKMMEERNLISLKEKELEILNPTTIINMGYSMVMIDNKRIKSIKDIKDNAKEITNHFKDGKIVSTIVDKK